MNVTTLMVGYEPSALETLKGAQLTRHQYFQDTLARYNFGEVLFLSENESKEQITSINPLLVFVTHDTIARELKEIKSDYLLYVIPNYNQIFARKAEVKEKKEKLNKIFTEAEGVIAEVLSGEKEDKDLRHFASLSYKDMYDMITKALISDDEDLKKNAWDLLWDNSPKHSNLIWMRVQMMADCWQHSKGESLEQLMLMSMECHLEMDLVRQMDDFIDADGNQYHQYMFLDPYGRDVNHIRRLPYAHKNEDRYAYEARLEKSEIPTNFLRVQLEANQYRQQCDEYLEAECEKIQVILDSYEKNPKSSKSELGITTHNDDQDKKPLSKKEVTMLKQMQKENKNLMYKNEHV